MIFKKNKANHVPLSPINFLERTAKIFPSYTSIISETKNLLGTKLSKDVIYLHHH